jgi:hypothetical protein
VSIGSIIAPLSDRRPAASAVFLGAILTLASAGSLRAEDFRFPELNRRYAQFVQELVPIEIGPARIDLVSPEHELDLVEHGARLEPAELGGHHVHLELVLKGRGLLDADLDISGVKGHLADELTLPVQALVLDGRIDISSAPEGWHVTLLEAPEQVEVLIESRLASRMVPLCKQMALVLVRFDCVALEQSLSRVQVPLPGPGEVFLLPREEIQEAAAARLDAYLRGSP